MKRWNDILPRKSGPAKHARRADLRDSKMYCNNLQTVFTSLKISLNVVWPCIPEISNFRSQNQAVASFHAQNHLASATERRSLAMANSRAVSPRACQQSDWIAGMHCKNQSREMQRLGCKIMVRIPDHSESQYLKYPPRSSNLTAMI